MKADLHFGILAKSDSDGIATRKILSTQQGDWQNERVNTECKKKKSFNRQFEWGIIASSVREYSFNQTADIKMIANRLMWVMTTEKKKYMKQNHMYMSITTWCQCKGTKLKRKREGERERLNQINSSV